MEDPKTPKSETPFQKFERLAKKLVAIPKGRIEKPKGAKPT